MLIVYVGVYGFKRVCRMFRAKNKNQKLKNKKKQELEKKWVWLTDWLTDDEQNNEKDVKAVLKYERTKKPPKYKRKKGGED